MENRRVSILDERKIVVLLSMASMDGQARLPYLEFT
jgi:hypothetical protein